MAWASGCQKLSVAGDGRPASALEEHLTYWPSWKCFGVSDPCSLVLCFHAPSGLAAARLDADLLLGASLGSWRGLERMDGRPVQAQRVAVADADADADANAAQDQLSSRRSKQEHDTLVDLLPHLLT